MLHVLVLSGSVSARQFHQPAGVVFLAKYLLHYVLYCTFELEHVRVILGSFGALLPNKERNSNTVHPRVKRTKIWASGVYVV